MSGCFKWRSSLFSAISSPPIKTWIKTRSKVLSIGPLASVLAALLMMLFMGAAKGRASSGWKPLGADDLDVTATSIGYPDADAAILLREGDLDDDSSEGTSLKIYVRMKVFNERGRRYGDVRLPYRLDLGKIADVHARTVRPDGKAIEVEKKDIFDKLLITSGRSVWRAKTFSMPSVEPGSIIEYRYRQVYPAGFGYFALDLQSDLFIKELRYRMKPERASPLDVRWVSFNSPNPDDFTPKWNGTYNIEARNIPPFRREPMMPPELAVKVWGWLYYSKETETDPDKYWSEYGQHMYEQSVFQTRPTPSIHTVVDSITLATDNRREKIARIYDYVRRDVRSVDESEARASHLKHNSDADQTIRRRYGTPAEINVLFVAMLRAAGLDARVAELTTRDESLFHRSFPDAFQFNSEITAVAAPDGKFEFFDPGSRYCPAGMLAWEKEGVPALIYDKENPVFVVTPVTPADQNRQDRVMTVTPLADGRLGVRTQIESAGHRAVDFRSQFAGSSPEEQGKRVIEELHTFLSSAALSSPIKVTGLKDEQQPVLVSYAFVTSAFAPPTEKRLLLRPALLSRRDESLLPSMTRINKVYFHYPWSETDQVTIELPEGFAPEQLPDDVSIDIGAASYRSAYHHQSNSVVYERRLRMNGIIFDVDQYQTLKSFFDRVHQADQAVLSLRR
jgi:hypothetical protein